MGNEFSADAMAERHQQAELAAAEKAKEAGQKAPEADSAAALQGVADAQTARVRTAEEIAQGQEGADTDRDEDMDSDHESDTDTKTDFDKDQDALMAEFQFTDTGDPKRNFYLVAEKLAHEVQDKHGVPWQVCLAQACIESGYGHDLGKAGREGYVIFGIKGTGYQGKVVESGTQEGAQGERREQASFRGYSSIRESFDGYGQFLTESFPDAFRVKNDPTLFAAALEVDPHHMYAEDKEYLEKIKTFWGKEAIDVGAGGAASSTPGKKEEESWFSQTVEYVKGILGQVKDAFFGLLASWGFKWAEKKKEEAPATSEVAGDWKEKVEHPDAPVFSFGKGVEGEVTSPFGEREDPYQRDHGKPGVIENHHGVDIGVPDGTAVYATQTATIVESPPMYKGAYSTIFKTADGVEFTFHHLQEQGLPAGTVVPAGGKLGVTGEKGYSTGPHLHVAAKVDGHYVDPKPYLIEGYRAPEEQLAARNATRVEAIRGEGSRLA